MWIVRVALSRPYTFIVLALLILIASPVVVLRTPTDIFPNIDIPVIAVAWQFTGLNPEEMEGRITTQYERVLTTTVDNIEHIEPSKQRSGSRRTATKAVPRRDLMSPRPRRSSRRRARTPSTL